MAHELISGNCKASEASVPEGWTFNPSKRSHRQIMFILSLCAFAISGYLASFELGCVAHVWDPFFAAGSEKVMTSFISHAFPIPDAALGAIVYLLDALLVCVGDENRWCTSPWVTFLLAALVVPASVTALILIILQPTIIHSWCTLCLVASTLMLIMLPFALAEFAAAARLVFITRSSDVSLLQVLLQGDGRLLAPNEARR
ncbi:MAG TPA: vitamin K epoxide reductase family protein [Candidatus Obscuribacterales bacterium]